MAGAGVSRRLALEPLPGPLPGRALHLLPCAVGHDGAAPVRRFFAPALRRPQDEPAVSFRGRSLKGKEVLLPERYVGLVVEEDPAPLLESEEPKLQVRSTFESLTVWNLEQAPDGSSEVLMALGWPRIAEGIHAPVAED